MKELFLGEYIRQERLKQRVTQEQTSFPTGRPIFRCIKRKRTGNQGLTGRDSRRCRPFFPSRTGKSARYPSGRVTKTGETGTSRGTRRPNYPPVHFDYEDNLWQAGRFLQFRGSVGGFTGSPSHHSS